MLEKIASKTQTTVLVLIVGLLSAVFILQFGGPQAQGCTEGGSTYAAKVYGRTISQGEFRGSYALARFDSIPVENQQAMDLRRVIVDGIVDRELLAAEAERVGLSVEEGEVVDQLAADATVYLTLSADAPPGVWSSLNRFGRPNVVDFAVVFRTDLKDEEGVFDADQAERVIQNGLRRSVNEFLATAERELLAEKMRDVVRASVQVSPSEVWDTYAQQNDRASVTYVRFSPAYFRTTLEPSDAEIRAWMAAHTEEVDREYEANRHRYTNLEPQVRARHILIRVSPTATDEEKAAARAKIQAALRRARAGEDFATLAREISEDSTAAEGGDLGYNPRGRMQAAFDEAQFALDVGQISDVVETSFGYHIIQVVGKREGDVPVDEAKRELAERLYREARSVELAEEAARAALARLRDGGSFEDVVAPYTPSDEEARNPLAPEVRSTREFGRGENPIAGTNAGTLVRAAFERTMENPLPDEPVRLGRDVVVFRLDSRRVPDRAQFTADVQAQIADGLLTLKRADVVSEHVRILREHAESEEGVRINPDVLHYGIAGAADETEGDTEEGG